MPWPFRRIQLRFGRYAEIRGAEYLRSLGYLLLACPYLARGGEIDIVSDDAGTRVFVEVKARRGDENPEDAVNIVKQSRIVRAAREVRRQSGSSSTYRYDILAVVEDQKGELRFRLIKDAFREKPVVS
jgi:Holliday junction resolvase-like predicted endonuclease